MQGALRPHLNRTTLNGVAHDSNFNDFDIRPYLKYDDTVGVWLEWYNTSVTNKTVSFRPDGSTSDWRQDFSIFRVGQYCYRYCPVPDNGIIEIYSDHANNVMYLRGEFGEGAVFNDNNPTSIEHNVNGWIDNTNFPNRIIPADAGNVEAALLMIYYAALGKTQSFRKNGSTDNLQKVISPSDFIICGVDDNDIFEQNLLSNTVHDVYYIGYIKKNSGVTWFTNYVQEYTTLTTDAWTELDITNASIPSDANYLICRLDTKLIDSGLRVRGIGSTIDESAINSGSATYRIDYVPIKNGKIEYYTDLSTSSIYSMGYGYYQPPYYRMRLREKELFPVVVLPSAISATALLLKGAQKVAPISRNVLSPKFIKNVFKPKFSKNVFKPKITNWRLPDQTADLDFDFVDDSDFDFVDGSDFDFVR